MDDKITANPTISSLSFEDMPLDEEDFVPINNVQLSKSLYEFSKHIKHNDIENFYNDFKKLMSRYTLEDKTMKISEAILRKHIRKLLFEIEDFNSRDPLDVAADEDEAKEKEYNIQRKAVEKNTLDRIAKEIGASGPSGVKRIEQQGLSKLKFILKDLEPGELEDIKLIAAKDYVQHLEKSASKTGEPLEKDELELLKKNLDIVMTLDGYRQFLRKYILASARTKGIKL
jgi:hypothetical protein